MKFATLMIGAAILGCFVACKKSNDTHPFSVTAISPTHAPGGTNITISGYDFASNPAHDTVTINGKAATVVYASSTSLVVTVPSFSGSGIVSVTTGGAMANGPSFTYDTVYAVTTVFNDLTQLTIPQGLCTDPAGNLYVVDYGSSQILEIATNGKITILSGAAGKGHVDGAAATAEFNFPHAICRDGQGNLYIAESGNNDIRMLSAAGVVSTLAGGTRGSANGTGTAAGFYSPIGICTAAGGAFYITDWGNNSLRTMTGAGVVGTLLSSNIPSPEGICTDNAGNILVAVSGANKIVSVTPAGVVTTFAGSGTAGHTDGPAASASFNSPYGLCMDAGGNVYVVDANNFLIRKISASGVVSTIAGNGTRAAVDGIGTAAGFDEPFGICVDQQGHLYVSDNNLIRKLTMQ